VVTVYRMVLSDAPIKRLNESDATFITLAWLDTAPVEGLTESFFSYVDSSYKKRSGFFL